MSYTQDGRSVGYSNNGVGQAAGRENHVAPGQAPPTPLTYNISVGNAEPRGVEKMTPGVSPPQWHR